LIPLIHNTYLSKIYSEVFETNALRPNYLSGSDTIIPIVDLSNPVSDFILSSNSVGTIFTTPANQDFYLLGATITASNGPGGTHTFTGITFTTARGLSASINVFAPEVPLAVAGFSNTNTTAFGTKGILLARNSTIVYAQNTDMGEAFIWGYYGSNRA